MPRSASTPRRCSAWRLDNANPTDRTSWCLCYKTCNINVTGKHPTMKLCNVAQIANHQKPNYSYFLKYLMCIQFRHFQWRDFYGPAANTFCQQKKKKDWALWKLPSCPLPKYGKPRRKTTAKSYAEEHKAGISMGNKNIPSKRFWRNTNIDFSKKKHQKFTRFEHAFSACSIRSGSGLGTGGTPHCVPLFNSVFFPT